MSEYISEAEESVVSEAPEAPEESVTEVVEPAPVEASVEEAPEESVEEAVEPASVAEEAEEPVEEAVEPASVAVEPASANEVEAVEEVEEVEEVPAEQVASDIREILVPVTTEVEESSGLTDDLKQRIAELDYLRECCSSWVGSGRAGKRNFLTTWTNKSVTVDSNVNYEDTLNQLEKLPEIVKLWAERKVRNDSNHFKNIQSYTLERSLFNEKSVTEKVEVVEKLINLLINCVNGKMRTKQIEEVIENLY